MKVTLILILLLLKVFVDWKVVDRNEYVKNVENFLCNIVICDSVGCEIDHRETIDANYVYIKNTMMKAPRNIYFQIDERLSKFPVGMLFVSININVLGNHF